MEEELMSREEAEELWNDAQWERCCSCHINPPCSYCVDGFSLELEEYLELYAAPESEPVSETDDAYERAMGIFE